MVALERGQRFGVRAPEGGGERHGGLLPGVCGALNGAAKSTLTCTGPPGNRPARAVRPTTPAVRWAAAPDGERSNGAANGAHGPAVAAIGVSGRERTDPFLDLGRHFLWIAGDRIVIPNESWD
ncbi:hypothetical protein GCM10010371_22320 [Streptomyces subrutilus]|uniref:Uncharacterized protein n=1 Tax=Streptomyces subrutilus TaxID=36818 RepID=A0A918QN17_9ACTN|nr:hypothetical protein GCM10010371_22320 [Streptomyces subrutilus]